MRKQERENCGGGTTLENNVYGGNIIIYYCYYEFCWGQIILKAVLKILKYYAYF